MAHVLILVFTDPARDPRVDRQIAALSQRHRVTVAGAGSSSRHEGVRHIDLTPPDAPAAARMNQAAGLARILARASERAYFGNRLVRHATALLDDVRPDLVLSNDIETLPLAFRVAHGAPVVFDAHEYYPGGYAHVAWWRVVMAPHIRELCRRWMPQAAATMTVSPGIAERYRAEFGVDPVVVTNAPPRAELEPSPVELPIRLVHHGAADRPRRIDRMIELMRDLDDRFTLDLMLVDMGGEVRRLRKLAAGDPRISFPDTVPMPDIVRTINRYDVGVYLLDSVVFNQREALPNKLFEFIQARLAVAIGPSPAMARVVREWGCGVVAGDFSPEALAAALSDLDPGRIAELKARSHAAADALSAERNAERLVEVVEGALR
jgi:glycosyltransferase involved in cell wall biosynthesis